MLLSRMIGLMKVEKLKFYKFDDSSKSKSSNDCWYRVNIDVIKDKTENQNNISDKQD